MRLRVPHTQTWLTGASGQGDHVRKLTQSSSGRGSLSSRSSRLGRSGRPQSSRLKTGAGLSPGGSCTRRHRREQHHGDHMLAQVAGDEHAHRTLYRQPEESRSDSLVKARSTCSQGPAQ